VKRIACAALCSVFFVVMGHLSHLFALKTYNPDAKLAHSLAFYALACVGYLHWIAISREK
jgi:hypothetical protein